MRLFRCDNYSGAKADGNPLLSTPLGNLALACNIAPPTHALELSQQLNKHTSRESVIYEWVSSQCLLEAMIVAFSPQSSIALPGLVCHAILLRVKALSSRLATQFKLTWLPDHRWIEGCGEPGEGLEARTWVDEQWKVTIGTEDCESLAARARTEMWMPRRLAPVIEASTGEIVQVGHDSMSINLPDIRDAECCQVHFVIASNRRKEEDISTWLAVDQQPSKLLSFGDCDIAVPPL